MLLSQKHSLRKAKLDDIKVIKLCPIWWKGYYRLASCHMELDEWTEAKEHLTKASKLTYDLTEIQRALKVVARGILESSLNYQEQHELYKSEKKQFNEYRNPETFYHSDSSDEEVSFFINETHIIKK